MKYCLGFVFAVEPTTRRTYVALIEKVKPDWQKGKLNGIGGEIEIFDATDRAAMIREFREETAVDTNPEAWREFAVMQFKSCQVVCFTGWMDWEKFNTISSPTKEHVFKIAIDSLSLYKCLPNLSWLVPMAQAFLARPDLAHLQIWEK